MLSQEKQVVYIDFAMQNAYTSGSTNEKVQRERGYRNEVFATI